jgi:iodotyrosine deiodinase
MRTIPLAFEELPEAEMRGRAEAFYVKMCRRRSVREFSSRPVPREIIADCLRTAGAAPSGANLQPWHFAVLGDPAVKRRLREAAEAEERVYYAGRAPDAWLGSSAPMSPVLHKSFLETAPWIIAVFARPSITDAEGSPRRTCFLQESVGISCGFLIAALHEAGLATFVHAPSPASSLNEICGRPATEVPFLLVVAGYPAAGATVPANATPKLPLETIVSWH